MLVQLKRDMCLPLSAAQDDMIEVLLRRRVPAMGTSQLGPLFESSGRLSFTLRSIFES